MEDAVWVLPFERIALNALPLVGGKGANLGELTRAGFPVPPGFCVTTAAFRAFRAGCDAGTPLAAVRMPEPVARAIIEAWEALGSQHAYAVRSSATAEDLPTASFAGLHESYLNVQGRESLLARVRDCWISLFTDRATAYRRRNAIDEANVAMAVVVQRMVRADAAGVLFTADPVSGRRTEIAIEAVRGLADALVSGRVTPERYAVEKRTRAVLKRTAGTPVLSDEDVTRLAEIGARIEAHYGRPQDIEWCVEKGEIRVVQSRPITTLYPLPAPAPADGALHVYLSFGHAQMMTEAMPPLARSVLRRVPPVGRDRGIVSAGGRLYVDPTPVLWIRPLRRALPPRLRILDHLMSDALVEVTRRPEFLRKPPLRLALSVGAGFARLVVPALARAASWLCLARPEGAAERARARADAHIERLRRRLDSTPDLRQRLLIARHSLDALFRTVVRPMIPLVLAGNLALAILRRMFRGRPEERDVDALARGVPGNVTTDMVLQIGDLADVARQRGLRSPETMLADAGFAAALRRFLDRYGMRGPGEIDVTRPRWRDDPRSLLRTVLGNLERPESGQHRTHFARLAAEGEAAAARLQAATCGLRRVAVRRLTRVCRNLLGCREHPKFHAVRLFDLLMRAVRDAARELRHRGRIDREEDVAFLEFPEIPDALNDRLPDARRRIAERRAEHERDRMLVPPRVMTSEGENVIVTAARADLPPGALAGSGVSAGIVEGPARVILDPASSVLAAGEILVAPFTDPGWTPLFINAAGLVTEVGGFMTHGSVIAREYGIPAVVAVVDATKLIRTGQRIRVNGDRGSVEPIS